MTYSEAVNDKRYKTKYIIRIRKVMQSQIYR